MPRRWVDSLAVLLLLFTFYFMSYVRQDYTRHMPGTPDPSIGRTEAVEADYGKTVFVTPDERRRYIATHAAVPIAAVCLLVLAVARTTASKGRKHDSKKER